MSQRGPKKSTPPASDGAAAAAFGQDLLTQLTHDLGAHQQREAQKKQAAADLANALLSKVATDFASVAPPPPSFAPPAPAQAPQATHASASYPPSAAHAPPPSHAPSSAAPVYSAPPPAGPSREEGELLDDSQGPLSAEELADLDAMTGPSGFWGKLVSRLRRKRGE